MNIIENLGVTALPVITVIVFLVGEITKATPINEKWVPIVCGVSGGILGVIAQQIMPEFPSRDVLTSIAIGIVSGLAATGAHQIYKQLATKDNNKTD